ncbi:MAG: Unknown protein [uncultured Sulfurovum sp.]|uniref:Uncharacterized protein n=1 Tax=uncultured Sulfurovum sp. TaxID=269237 RepID=A0A6S6TT18_9BACT|nr:MAG: Unknown protein [uncultured Sulfurovum sp.]
MYREIIRVTNENHMIKIPKEYLDQEVEILVLPFSYVDVEKKRKFNIENITPIMKLQVNSMKQTWNNSDDEAWDDL